MQRSTRPAISRRRPEIRPALAALVALAALMLAMLPATPALAREVHVLTPGAGMGVHPSHAVGRLQRALEHAGFTVGRPGVDGRFGPLTAAAVGRLQARYGLQPDAVVGPATRRVLARLTRGTGAEARRRLGARGESNTRGARAHTSAHRTDRVRPMRAAPNQTTPNQTTPTLSPGTASLLAAVAVLVLAGLLLPGVRRRAGLARLGTLGATAGPELVGFLRRMAEFLPRPPIVTTRSNHSPCTTSHSDSDHRDGHAADIGPVRNGSTPRAMTDATARRSSSVRMRTPSDAGATVVGYVSVGRDEYLSDADAFGTQVRAIEEFCEHAGLRLLRILRDVVPEDDGPACRPALRHGVAALSRGDASALVTHDVGRLTRSFRELAALLRWFSESRRTLIVVNHQLDSSTPAGRDAIRLLIATAEWECRRAAESRTRAAVDEPLALTGPSDLRRRIEALRAQGVTLQAIADTLNAEHVPTLRGSLRWRASSVHAAAGFERRPSWAEAEAS